MDCQEDYGRSMCDADQPAIRPYDFAPIRPLSRSPPTFTLGSTSPPLSWREVFSIDVILRPDPPAKRRRISCSSLDRENERPCFDSEVERPLFYSDSQPSSSDTEGHRPHFYVENQPSSSDSETHRPYFYVEYQPSSSDSEDQRSSFDYDSQRSTFDYENQRSTLDSSNQRSSFEGDSPRSDSARSTEEQVIYRPVPMMAFRHRIPATLAYSWARYPMAERVVPVDYYRMPPAPIPAPLPVSAPIRLPEQVPMPHPINFTEAVQRLREQEEQANQARRIRPKKFACSFPGCKNTFSNRGQLNGHYRIHTGERPFKCDIGECKKDFTRNEELTRHKRIHTKVKPYICNQCEKAFGRRDHLRKHQRIHERALLLQVEQHYEAIRRLFIFNPGQN